MLSSQHLPANSQPGTAINSNATIEEMQNALRLERLRNAQLTENLHALRVQTTKAMTQLEQEEEAVTNKLFKRVQEVSLAGRCGWPAPRWGCVLA